ncbi:MAG TPA: mucoidy inhibitor MuiA family protein [Tepidisphaeraceae bacterium]|nr:mucoidy inhibitor MuiA family protein [Tepidisphaeraceae bacterium]
MCKLVAMCLLVVAFTCVMGFAQVSAPDVAPATQPVDAAASSRIVAVTVYQGTALVTREVEVKEGRGLIEVVVRPLPPQTIDSSLFTEGGDGLRVLTTRLRTRAVMEDTRAEVRAREDQIRKLNGKNQELQKQLEVIGQNQAMLNKLESFTAATMQQLAEKGLLNSDSTIKLANYVVDQREKYATQQVSIQQQVAANQQQIEFLQRQLAELAAGASRTEREAVITVDKSNDAAGKVRLNYLVNAAGWQPQYKLRAGGEKDPVQVEYLAAIQQQSGEDWGDVELVLSTAQPMLNAAPPELLALDVTVAAPGQQGGVGGAGGVAMGQSESYRMAKGLRLQAQQEAAKANSAAAFGYLNSAAASEQYAELLAREEPNGPDAGSLREGPSVAYHLPNRLTIPSRNDPQLVEVARLDLEPTNFYKAVPVLSPHVYRQALLTNKSKYVLLPGEATMYVGTDFVGRMSVPLVAIGEQFTVGFGIDPQIQVDRQLVSRSHSIQGGNQVQVYDYRIRITSYKTSEVQLQVWDRLPKSDTDAVAVELMQATPDVSKDADYVRQDRPRNLLRWDLTVKPSSNRAPAATISYEFKLQYDRNVSIGTLQPAKQ